jgi:hypothetical protein
MDVGLVGGKMLLHKPHSPHPCGLAMQEQLPRGLGGGNQHREKALSGGFPTWM